MEWDDVSEKSRDWLKLFGNFGPTVMADKRELKGWTQDEEGVSKTYLSADELREAAAAFVEAADWLDKRAQEAK